MLESALELPITRFAPPVALVSAEADGRLRPGSRVLLSAFGAGFTRRGAVIEWGLRG